MIFSWNYGFEINDVTVMSWQRALSGLFSNEIYIGDLSLEIPGNMDLDRIRKVPALFQI